MVLWAGLLQLLVWEQDFSPYVPLTVSSLSMFISQGMGVVGLAFLARSRGRRLGWSLLGFIPLAGPLLGLVVLLNPWSRQEVGEMKPSSRGNRVGYGIVCFIFGLVGLGIILVEVFERPPGDTAPRLAKVSPDGSARIVVNDHPLGAAIYLDEVRGVFITSRQNLIHAGDHANISQAIWSKDGKWVIFIGADSDTQPDGSLLAGPHRQGHQTPFLFILFDRVSGQVRYNSVYHEKRKLAPFTRKEVEAIQWEEPLYASTN